MLKDTSGRSVFSFRVKEVAIVIFKIDVSIMEVT